MSHACHLFRTCYKTLTLCSLLTRCTIPCACHAKRHLNVQECSEPVNFIHNCVHFLDISTPKTGPSMVCFVHFGLEMCFAPQLRALFHHLNFQKWSGPGVFCTFGFQNVLRTTRACTFSTSQLRNKWSDVGVFCTFCHNGVQLFISHLAISRLSYLFAHLDLLSASLLFSDPSHLCFSSVHIVGSLTSKLPSAISDYCEVSL